MKKLSQIKLEKVKTLDGRLNTTLNGIHEIHTFDLQRFRRRNIAVTYTIKVVL